MKQLTKDVNINLMPSGNRTIKPQSVKKIKESINKYGIVRPLVIISTSLFGNGEIKYIADGQHLYMAAQALGLEEKLFYVESEAKFENIKEIMEFVALLNATQSPWKLLDYISAFSSTNQFIDYNILYSKILKYGISPKLTSMVYGGLGSTAAAKSIKKGTFKIVDETKGDEIIKILQDVILLTGRNNSRCLVSFVMAFYNWYSSVSYDHKRFMKYLEENIKEVKEKDGQEMANFLNAYR